MYLIYTVFNQIVGFVHSRNAGRRLENIVFLHLRKRASEIFYFLEKNECDFVLKTNGGSVELFQVCHELNTDNRDREIKGLQEAMPFFDSRDGTILTCNQE